MSGWHLGALAAFDVESTSVHVDSARIVTAAILVRGGGIPETTQTWLTDAGGEEIPAEATAIHGITTEKARAEGMSAELAVQAIGDELYRILRAGIPLVIYNAPFDLTVLDRECRRYGFDPFTKTLRDAGGLIIDPFTLDKAADKFRRGKRTLTATCEHYRVTLDGAHDATADALAAMRVAWRIGQAYPAIAAMSPDELHEYQVTARAEQAASFEEYLRKQGKPEPIDPSWPVRELAEVRA